MSIEDNEDFDNYNKYLICDSFYVDDHVEVRNHFYITGKYRGLAHRDSNVKFKFNLCRISQPK